MRYFVLLLLVILALGSCKKQKDDFLLMRNLEVDQKRYELIQFGGSILTDYQNFGKTDDLFFFRDNISNISSQMTYWRYRGYKFTNDSIYLLELEMDNSLDSISYKNRYGLPFVTKDYFFKDDTISVYKVPEYGRKSNEDNLKPSGAEFFAQEFGYICFIGIDRTVNPYPPDNDIALREFFEILKKDNDFYSWNFPNRFTINKSPRE